MRAANVLFQAQTMITGRYNTDTIVWWTELVRACRLMPGAQTDMSNSCAKYYLVGQSLSNTLRDL